MAFRSSVIPMAMADPLNIIAIDTVSVKIKRQIKVVVSSDKDILDAIDVIYHGSHIVEQRLRSLVELELDTEEDIPYDNDVMEADISEEEAAAILVNWRR